MIIVDYCTFFQAAECSLPTLPWNFFLHFTNPIDTISLKKFLSVQSMQFSNFTFCILEQSVWTSLLLWKVLWKNGTMERLIVPVKAPTYKEVKWGLAAIYQGAPPKRTAPKLHLGLKMFWSFNHSQFFLGWACLNEQPFWQACRISVISLDKVVCISWAKNNNKLSAIFVSIRTQQTISHIVGIRKYHKPKLPKWIHPKAAGCFLILFA